MKQDYSQPFFVGRDNPRFRGVNSGGYLPPIEPIREPETLPIIPPEHKLYGELQQAKAKLNYLQNKINKHLDKRKEDSY